MLLADSVAVLLWVAKLVIDIVIDGLFDTVPEDVALELREPLELDVSAPD